MFKKIRENEKYKFLKKLWDNPKYRPIISLLLWGVFFVIVVVMVRFSTSNVSREVVSKEVDASNYEFTYYNDLGKIYGSYYDGKMMFIMNGNRYFYDNDVYLVSDNTFTLQNGFDLGLLKIDLKFINNLISGLNYNDINGGKQYLVPLTRFINLYEIDTDLDLSNLNLYNISVEVYDDDNVIYMIKLDLSNYYLVKGISDSGLLTIDVYNMNNVADFSKGYDGGGI